MLLNDLAKSHVRAHPCHVGRCPDEFADFWKFQSCVRKYRWNLRVQAARDVQQNGGILAAGEADVDVSVPVFIPFADAQLRFDDLRFQRQRAHLL